jgi:putative endonuclease
VGAFGEQLAARFLEKRGVVVLGRNVRIGHGEIDLHVRIDGAPVAVEVKTIVATSDDDDAVYQFTPEKAHTVRRYARRLTPPAYRIDLVAVTLRAAGADIHWVPHAG